MSAPVVPSLAGRADLDAIAGWVTPGASVLDLGCGEGLLLQSLKAGRNVRGYGIEISDANVLACVNNGVNVIQSDLEAGLAGFDAGSFDFVILSQTLQAMRHTEEIILEMLRVGRQGIVSFPNFGYWRQRLQRLVAVDADVELAPVDVLFDERRRPNAVVDECHALVQLLVAVHHGRLRNAD